jgi:hypothetical protein
MLAAFYSRHGDMMNSMKAENAISPENESKLVAAIKAFIASYKV